MATSAATQSILLSPMACVACRSSTTMFLPSTSLPYQQRTGRMQVRCNAEETEKSIIPETNPTTPLLSPPPPAPKVNTSLSDLLAFSGPAPERINGRLAMTGFVAALAVELAKGDGLVAQLANGGLPWFLGTSVLLSLASLIPLSKGVSVESKSDGVMTSSAEMWNGRFAMLGLVALAFTEFVTGSTLV
ncbi:hypothetical protein GIB67_027141 [Kingdonia uniflora]|uniref:Early light-induced protein n=1 Tax=Kingdonia uniflora TaxID=39325 RepID=A0A7J7P1Y0_9MAGN|nr:hypothetical protein GIB67_027141 [Kingdonia uniflora]